MKKRPSQVRIDIEEIKLKVLDKPNARNSARVPAKQWRQWGDAARMTFNDVYYTMTENQEFFRHPTARVVAAEHWVTTCWNAAWTAAEATQKYTNREK